MAVSLAKKIEMFNNSPDAAEFVEEYNMNCRIRRVGNKALENMGKKPLKSPDVLNADDFIFTPFVQKRGSGDSGSLYMASGKDGSARKYIVKHAYCNCAANEYVYSKILKALGLKTPEVKLFRLSNSFDGSLFKTEYVAGIEYLGAAEKPASREAVSAAENAADYYSFLTLEFLLRDMDGVEFLIADGGSLYRIDMADSFLVADFMLIAAGLDKSDKHKFNGHVLQQAGSLEQMRNDMKRLIESHGEDKAGALLKPVFGIQKIRKPYINGFLETLRYFYPDCVCDYYGEYISTLQKTAKRFTGAAAVARTQAAPLHTKRKTG